jgi:protein SSD1
MVTFPKFMLLTNIAVAQHVAVHLPEQALLRRHDNPLERRLVSKIQLSNQLSFYNLFLEHISTTC